MDNNYFLKVPHYILRDKRISDKTKLVFGQVNSLCTIGSKNYCEVTDGNLAKIFGLSRRMIQNHLSKLEECGYIIRDTKSENERGEKGKWRKIYLTSKVEDLNPPY
jgi:DNA-binding MarR family transcriptional regulator